MFIIIGLGIGGLIGVTGMVDDKLTAVWLLTISPCGLGICSPNTWTLTQAVCSRNIVGTVSGFQNFGGNLGGIMAPALTGYIAHTTQSFALALTVAGAVLVVAILSYSFLISQKVSKLFRNVPGVNSLEMSSVGFRFDHPWSLALLLLGAKPRSEAERFGPQPGSGCWPSLGWGG